MKAVEEPVVVSQQFTCPASLLWDAITDVEQMKKWYFPDIPDFQARTGFETGFDVDTGERTFHHRWEVVEVEPKRLLAYVWTFAGYPGKSTSVFEIEDDDQGCQLTLTCIVHEDFPDDIPEFTRDACLGGWNYFIKDSLKAYLDGGRQA